MTIHAIYENGVFVPRGKVDLPERTLVHFDPIPELPFDPNKALRAMPQIIGVLDQRVASGDSDVAARHNEHQP